MEGKRLKIFVSLVMSVLFIVVCSDINAAEKRKYYNKKKNTTSLISDSIISNTLSNKMDSVVYLKRDSTGLIIMPKAEWLPFDSDITFADTIFFDPAFLPIVFDGKILPDSFTLQSSKQKDVMAADFNLIDRDSTFYPQLKRLNTFQNLRKSYYAQHPELVKINALTFDKSTQKITTQKISNRNIFKELITAEAPTEITAPDSIGKFVPKKMNWIINGEHSLQVSQNYISDNWYKGGNSSFYVRNYHKFTFNHKKDKLSFNNMIEWKLNLQQTPADTVHDIGINDDLLRMVNTLGLRAFDKWTYTATLETKTQLFNSYPINSNVKNTSLLSPLILNLGVGMDYSLEKNSSKDKYRKFKVTQNIAPLTLIYTYVGDDEVDETKFGLEKDEKSKLDLGSSLNTNMTWSFNRYTTWTSRFKYLTNYHRVEAEFENRFDMALNKFLTTSVTLYLRFDDNVVADGGWGYLQRNELISFGLGYKW